MSDESESYSDEKKSSIIPVWKLLFDYKKEGEKNYMILDTLLNKKIKVWSVLANTINGVRSTMKGQTGILTSFDDEFIILDDKFILSRKFIYRIEYA